MTELKLDKKTRKALTGLMGFSNGSTVEFTPEVYKSLDIKDEFKPVFTQRAFTREEKAKLEEIELKSDTIRDYAILSVKGWKNLYAPDTGEEVKYTEDKAALLDLQYEIIMDLYKNAMLISGLKTLESLGLKSLPQSTSEQSQQSAGSAKSVPDSEK